MSEVKLQRNLYQAGRHRAYELAKGRIVDVVVDRVGAEELGIVERVDALKPKFEHVGFRQVGVLQQSDVPVVHYLLAHPYLSSEHYLLAENEVLI